MDKLDNPITAQAQPGSPAVPATQSQFNATRAQAVREWLSLGELAEWFGVDKHVIYWLNETGAAPPRYRIGRELRYRRSEVEQWLKARREAADQPA